MKILILGAGAIGGFFGAHLMKSGANVSFLVREKRKDELKKSGINIFSINGELKVNPKLLDKNLSGQHFDVIILTNKSYDLIESIREIKPYVNKTVIIPLLNGMAHYEILDKEFGKEKIFGGTAYISTAMNNYGSIQQITSRASIKFGPRTPKNINIAKDTVVAKTSFTPTFSTLTPEVDATVNVTGVPAGTEVFLDGVSKGNMSNTTLTFTATEPGTYTITLKKLEYLDYSTAIKTKRQTE